MGEWSAARPGRTLPPGKTRYPLYRRLGGPQGRSGREENLVVKYGTATQARDANIQKSMSFVCWNIIATDIHIHREYVILIAVTWQQWLSERALLSRLYAHRPFV